MNWPTRKLNHFARIDSGDGAPQDEGSFSNEGLPFIRAGSLAHLVNGKEEGEMERIAPAVAKKRKMKLFPAGTIVFAKSGMSCTKGLVHQLGQPCHVVNHLAAVQPTEQLDSRFLLRWLERNPPSRLIANSAYPSIKLSSIRSCEIPLPPISEQKRIAAILDAADALRAKRRETLVQLDTLLQSTFLEMFGDPVTNPRDWATEKLEDWLDGIESGWSPKCLDRQAREDEWGVLKLGAVTWCKYDEQQQKALPPGLEPRPQLEVCAGDLLFSRKNTSDLVAAAAYVHNTRSKLMLPDLIFRLRIKADAHVDPIFLWQLLIEPHQRQSIQRLAGGAAGSMPNISKAKLRSVELIAPPPDLQHKFAEIVQSIEQQKSRLRTHLDELDALFASLQARAFSGIL